MKLKSTILTTLLLSFAAQLNAAESPGPISIETYGTYGSYSGSVERKNFSAESVFIDYATEAFGANVGVKRWDLSRTSSLGDLNGTDTSVLLYARKKVGNEGYWGLTAGATYLSNNDIDTDKTLIPYVAIAYKTPDGGNYFDVGYSSMKFSDTTTSQYSATWGTALFNRYVWAQTKVYYNNLSQNTQGENDSFALEERVTWYVVPDKFSLTLSGLIGQSVEGYVYDILKNSVGLTAIWGLTPSLSLFANATHETYEKQSIDDNYSATYGTVGLKYRF